MFCEFEAYYFVSWGSQCLEFFQRNNWKVKKSWLDGAYDNISPILAICSDFHNTKTKNTTQHKYSETQKPKKERIKEAISVILIGVEDPVIDYWVAL